LFLFEIGYFVVKPLFSEMTQWWAMRQHIAKTTNGRLTLGSVAIILLLFVIPWSSTVRIPAILEATDVAHIYPPRAARIVTIHVVAGQVVRKGDKIAQLDSADLESDRLITLQKFNAVRDRLARISSDKEDRDDNLVLESANDSLRMKLEGLIKEQAELDLRAPDDGIIAELNPNLGPGQWIAAKEQIALLRGTDRILITGYVAETDLWRIEVGASGRFIPDMLQAPSAPATLQSIAVSGSTQIDPPELASSFGGRIEAFPDNRQRLIPVTAHYLVTLTATLPTAAPAMRLRGVVNVQGTAESFFAATWRRVLKVFVRESAA
jgi:putative peptide zinc metalloprotease protein